MSDVHKELRRMTKCWEKADDEVRRLREANASMADSLDDCCASLNEANGEITKLRKVVEATGNLLYRRECENFHELAGLSQCVPSAENICGFCALDIALRDLNEEKTDG